MKSKLEKIEALLLRSQNPAALHEVQQLIEYCGDLATKARLAPMSAHEIINHVNELTGEDNGN